MLSTSGTLMLYDFEMEYNSLEAAKTFVERKGNGEVDHSSVTRLLKNFRSGCKNIWQSDKVKKA